MELIFDTETTGFPSFKQDETHPLQPSVIQLAAILCDEDTIYDQMSVLINPADIAPDWTMEPGAEAAHGISREQLEAEGVPAKDALDKFRSMLERADMLVCHNTQFDSKLLSIAYRRADAPETSHKIMNSAYYCTMKRSTNLCQLPGKFGFKWPKLQELHQFLFNEGFDGAHDALNDVLATKRCYYEMKRRGL